MKQTLCLFFGLFLLAGCATPAHSGSAEAGLPQTYNQLALKDLDQMTVIVKKHVEASRKGADKIAPLKEGLLIVYSRPNQDGMIEKVVGPLRTEVDELEAWDKTLGDLVDEAVAALKDPKEMKATDQVTYAIFLENIVTEFKPRAKEEGFEKSLLTKIAEANIEMSREAKNERLSRTMKEQVSPSRTAALALDLEKEKKK